LEKGKILLRAIMSIKYFIYTFAVFMGYAIGRIGHIIGGQIIWIPHHWIFGLLLLFISLSYLFFKKSRKYVGYVLIFLSMGIIISDFKDFILMRIWGLDDVQIIKFWGIN